MEKKAQFGNLQSIVIALVVIGIVLGVGFLVLSEFKESTAIDEGTVTNESGAYVNTTGYTLSEADACGFNTPAMTAVWVNVSGTTYLIPAANYTVSAFGVLTNATVVPNATEYNDANVSYTYLYGEEDCEGVSSAIDAVKKIPTWLSIIVILAIVGILLTILFKVMPRRTEETFAEY